jgi:hypothetical protein
LLIARECIKQMETTIDPLVIQELSVLYYNYIYETKMFKPSTFCMSDYQIRQAFISINAAKQNTINYYTTNIENKTVDDSKILENIQNILDKLSIKPDPTIYS